MQNIKKPEEYTILDFVKVYKKALTSEQCSYVIKKIDDSLWQPHQWASYSTVVDKEEIDTNCNELSGISRILVSGCINTVVNEYKKNIKKVLGTEYGRNGMTVPRINRYTVGGNMAPHVDHITSIFDGERKGIPTLSIVGLLNDDFDGGEFRFWDKYNMDLEIGDIMVFPSNFLYKHQVDKVTRGCRYSFVSWIY
jgi:predicted 2-oxoglutarate/Fe(II)-dependent dioxygenase YbiX